MKRSVFRLLLAFSLVALALTLSAGQLAQAHEDAPHELSDVMKSMKKAMRTAARASDVEEMAVAFADLQSAAEKALDLLPDRVDDEVLTDEQQESYRTGVEQLQILVADGLAAAQAGDAAQAEAALDQIGELRNERHDFLGVGD